MSLRVYLSAIIALIVLSACATGTEESALPSPTNTAAPLPTPTLPPTPTRIPVPLGEIPVEFSAGDVSVVATPFVYQLQRVTLHQQLGNMRAPGGRVYVVIYGILYNYATWGQEFHAEDFQMLFNNAGEFTIASAELMLRAQGWHYPNAVYPQPDRRGAELLVIPPKRSAYTLLAFEAPENFFHAQLAMSNGHDYYRTGILFIPSEQDASVLNFYKESVNNQPIYTISIDENTTTVETVLDVEEATLDNCYGTAEIFEDRTFSRSMTQSVSVLTENTPSPSVRSIVEPAAIATSLVNTIVGDAVRFIGNQLKDAVQDKYQLSGETTMTESRTIRLTAAPGTHVRMQLTWYTVVIQGNMKLMLGDEVFDIPYSVNQRLRLENESLPGLDCPPATATP